MLALRDISKRFNGVHPLVNVSATFSPGTITGIVGENGCGKSTLFDVICGLTTPDAGHVSLAGTPIDRLPPHRRARLGIGRLFQVPRSFASLTVAEHLELGRLRRRAASYQLAPQDSELLEAFDLLSLSHQTVARLSFGQRKLVALATILLGDFRTVLLDEPVAGLSRHLMPAIGTALTSFASRERTILLVEHDREFVDHVADIAYELHSGRLSRVTVSAQGSDA